MGKVLLDSFPWMWKMFPIAPTDGADRRRSVAAYTADQIAQAIDNSMLVNCERYSGRGMYGKECPSAAFDDFKDALELIADVASEDVEMARWMARNSRIDSLGQGLVIYWPRVPYSDEARRSTSAGHPTERKAQ